MPLGGRRSSTCRDINYIRWKYDININDCCISALSRVHYSVVKEAYYLTRTNEEYIRIVMSISSSVA